MFEEILSNQNGCGTNITPPDGTLFFLIFTFYLKSSQNKKDLNDVTAAPFLVSFSQVQAAKNTKNGAAVMSLRSFLFRNNFSCYHFYPFGNGSYWHIGSLIKIEKKGIIIIIGQNFQTPVIV